MAKKRSDRESLTSTANLNIIGDENVAGRVTTHIAETLGVSEIKYANANILRGTGDSSLIDKLEAFAKTNGCTTLVVTIDNNHDKNGMREAQSYHDSQSSNLRFMSLTEKFKNSSVKFQTSVFNDPRLFKAIYSADTHKIRISGNENHGFATIIKTSHDGSTDTWNHHVI